jgi:hypothetical protein
VLDQLILSRDTAQYKLAQHLLQGESATPSAERCEQFRISLTALNTTTQQLKVRDKRSQVQLRKLCTYHLMLAELHLECPHTYSATFGARTEFLTENKRIMAYLGHYKAVAKYAIDLQNSAAKRYLIQHTLYQLLDIFADPEHRALSAIYFLPIYQDELFILSLKDTLETAHASLEKHISHMELRLLIAGWRCKTGSIRWWGV